MKRKCNQLILCLAAAIVLAWSAHPAIGENLTLFTDEDLKANYDTAAATHVDLDQQQGNYLISRAGTYVLTGQLSGQLVIQAPETDTVQLVFDGAGISNPDGVAVYGLNADKIILTLAEGSINSISDGVGYAPDEEGADAAIYAKTDLTINGSGSLQVNGQTAHGIVSKDSLVIAGGVLNIISVKDGLRGKDSVAVRLGSITITAGCDGIVSSGTQDGSGNVVIDGGSFLIKARRDGIQAENGLTISGGVFDIVTGAGAQAGDAAAAAEAGTAADTAAGATAKSGSRLQQGSQQDGSWQEPAGSGNTAETMKALKAGAALTIKGGQFNLNAQDDAIHSNGDVTIENGSFTISSGDDGVHADNSVLVSGGDITIARSYEGFEGKAVTIDGGMISIIASDDGINAANGTAAGRNREATQSGVTVTINAGTVKVIATNDGIDSNGTLTINGGTVDLTSQRGGSGGTSAIDTNGGYTHTAGQVTTNDGSESGTGMAVGPGFGPQGNQGFGPQGNQPPRRR